MFLDPHCFREVVISSYDSLHYNSLHNNYVWIIVQLFSTQYCIVMFLSTVTGEWSSPAETGTKPPPLSIFSFTKVDSRRAVVYGGAAGLERYGDAYVLELDKWVRA